MCVKGKSKGNLKLFCDEVEDWGVQIYWFFFFSLFNYLIRQVFFCRFFFFIYFFKNLHFFFLFLFFLISLQGCVSLKYDEYVGYGFSLFNFCFFSWDAVFDSIPDHILRGNCTHYTKPHFALPSLSIFSIFSILVLPCLN